MNAAHDMTSKLPFYEVYFIKITVLLKAIIKIIYKKLTHPTENNKLTNPTD